MWRAIVVVWLVGCVAGQKPNHVVDVDTTCDKGTLIVNIYMEQPFKGIVFSKDFSRECRVQGLSKYIP
jgi:hypothetical protein